MGVFVLQEETHLPSMGALSVCRGGVVYRANFSGFLAKKVLSNLYLYLIGSGGSNLAGKRLRCLWSRTTSRLDALT